MAAKIPIRNLWLLMFYASDLSHHDKTSRKDVEENPDDIADIVAEILCYHVEKRLRRNLSFGYQNKVATLNSVRGRIDLLYTESHQLLSKAEVRCRFAELTVDTPRNRYVRAALQYLAVLKQLDKERKHKCRMLAMQLEAIGVGRQKPHNYGAKSERFGLHDSADRLMLYAADLAFSLALPTDIDGNHYMLSPDRDKKWLQTLFEKAVLGFYTIKLEKCKVKSESLKWDRQKETKRIKDILPQMQTDISIKNKSSGERLIIDTKFNEIIIKGRHRDQTLRSDNIYQIYAYVRSQERHEDQLSWSTTGMLLHPTVGGEDYNETVIIQGHEFKFCTVNLAASAKHITTQLLELLPPQFVNANH